MTEGHPPRLLTGSPYPLGATWDGLGTNFAVFSAHASRMDLCLFDPSGRREIARMPMSECTDGVWHGYLQNAEAGLLYGYRAFGPYDPQNGHRFNPHKLLIDPYARRLAGELRWSDALFGYRLNSSRADLSLDRRDSARGPQVGRDGRVVQLGGRQAARNPVGRHGHLRSASAGFTMLHKKTRPHERGTFAALAEPKVIDYLRRLGVTAIEIMPIYAFAQDRHLLQKGLRNYWGYNTIGFFAIEPRYLASDSSNEMRVAVRRLHAAGIEVILDVVYNHTAEGSEMGPTLSFRGLDNASYYRLVADNPRRCVNFTGTGNTLNLSHPRVLQMVMDSLRYWVTSFHVDGFRFDLGVTLGREANGFDAGSGFFDALRQDPTLARIKLISEPWDLGPGGYQLGQHPPGFAEWNDRFRDGVRRFWRGDGGQRPDFAARLAGSSDLFDRWARRPWASVNYAASHDGFTLADTVSYVERHNEANGENNQDGAGENYSANWGVEGSTDDPKTANTRARVLRAMLATVFFAHGTPMLLAGDEFGRTQRGNNNAYCQDNDISWIDWEQARSSEAELLRSFVARLIALRRAYPTLRFPTFMHGKQQLAPGVDDISWSDRDGQPISVASWNNPNERVIGLRRAARLNGRVSALTLLLNPTEESVSFRMPEPRVPARVLIDTAQPDAPAQDFDGEKIDVAAHSAMLMVATHEVAP
jgi:isoamylase